MHIFFSFLLSHIVMFFVRPEFNYIKSNCNHNFKQFVKQWRTFFFLKLRHFFQFIAWRKSWTFFFWFSFFFIFGFSFPRLNFEFLQRHFKCKGIVTESVMKLCSNLLEIMKLDRGRLVVGCSIRILKIITASLREVKLSDGWHYFLSWK